MGAGAPGERALPTRDLGPDELDTGFGFEGTVRYRVLPHLAAYPGWDWMHFGAGESFAGSDVDFEETGYAFGLRFEHPFRGEAGGPAWWLRAGGTVEHIELEDGEGALVADTGQGLGWELGAGVALEVRDRWSFTPGLRYRALDRTVDLDGTTTELDLQYFSFELGLARLF